MKLHVNTHRIEEATLPQVHDCVHACSLRVCVRETRRQCPGQTLGFLAKKIRELLRTEVPEVCSFVLRESTPSGLWKEWHPLLHPHPLLPLDYGESSLVQRVWALCVGPFVRHQLRCNIPYVQRYLLSCALTIPQSSCSPSVLTHSCSNCSGRDVTSYCQHNCQFVSSFVTSFVLHEHLPRLLGASWSSSFWE